MVKVRQVVNKGEAGMQTSRAIGGFIADANQNYSLPLRSTSNVNETEKKRPRGARVPL